MNKSLEALVRGYVLFDVNGERFYLYSSALNRRMEISGAFAFKGFSLFKGWRMFSMRVFP